MKGTEGGKGFTDVLPRTKYIETAVRVGTDWLSAYLCCVMLLAVIVCMSRLWAGWGYEPGNALPRSLTTCSTMRREFKITGIKARDIETLAGYHLSR